MSRVGRVRARVDATCCDDAEEEDRVPDVVERVDADAIAALEAYGAETGDELPNNFEGAAGGDVVGGVEGRDIDLVKWLGWFEEMGLRDEWEAYGVVPVVG